MSRPYGPSLKRGLLALIGATALVASGFRAATTAAGPEAPPADRRDRIADLYSEARLMEVECAAARDNLQESLKKLGALRLCDDQEALESIKGQLEQLKTQVTMAASLTGRDSKALVDEFRTAFAKGEQELPREAVDLLPKFLGEGEESQKAADALLELELKMHVDRASAEAVRMTADYLETCRSMYLKKQELADAEARSGK